MKIVFQSDLVTLWHGDCREVIPTLHGVDAVLCDPPYGIRHKTSRGATWEGKEIAGDGDTVLRDWVWQTFADKPRAMFGISWRQPPPPDVRTVLIWDKGPAFGAGDLRMPWKPSWEEIYIGGTGWRWHRDEGVLRGPCVVSWESKGRVHPHQKPTWLFARLIEKLPEARTILDPFAGSGTTLLAAAEAGRQSVGVEVDDGYCAKAVARLEQWHAQGRLSLTANAPVDGRGASPRTVRPDVGTEGA
jgi:DNA modification methylase